MVTLHNIIVTYNEALIDHTTSCGRPAAGVLINKRLEEYFGFRLKFAALRQTVKLLCFWC